MKESEIVQSEWYRILMFHNTIAESIESKSAKQNFAIQEAPYSNNQTILVTGSSGFLGSELVTELTKLGFTVYALDNRPPSDRLGHSLSSFSNVYFITADVSERIFSKRINE